MLPLKTITHILFEIRHKFELFHLNVIFMALDLSTIC